MELLLVFALFLLAIGGLALGLMLTGRPPSDSCGGLASCAGACEVCPRRQKAKTHG
ncbi:hypothetical protein [Mesobacterium pallidum]|uniref:hypothetical protein n=1 Tax=Mesobacterium pallidum TaxID=2872037 RepID=UPI001EE1DCFA|nr:hypothetical protein [Mesobacterium pallidum]